jgi:hypothetical protein
MCSGRQISSPSQVISIIQFLSLPTSVDAQYRSFPDKFSIALKRYLKGRGHPSNDSFNSVPFDEREQVADDYTIRSRIFMKSITGSEYLPVNDPTNHISVCLLFLFNFSLLMFSPRSCLLIHLLKGTTGPNLQ